MQSLFWDLALKKDDGGFTLAVLRLPLKMVRHKCLKELGKRSGFDLKAELDSLEKRRPGIETQLIALGVMDVFKGDGLENLL